MPDHDDYYAIEGAHGTIAELNGEDEYDDRSDASDDVEKGQLNFPKGIYGRERELGTLRGLYEELVSMKKKKRETATPWEAVPYEGSRVVFLSGYAGTGKSALVGEFVERVRRERESSDGSRTLCASGECDEEIRAPFSAMSDVFERMASELSDASNDGLRSRIRTGVEGSDLIGPGSEGNRVLRATFAALAPLLDNRGADNFSRWTLGALSGSAVRPDMGAIKECAREILSVICEALDRPLILFLDDLQRGDGASMEILSSLLSYAKLRNIMFVCSYRSNEVDEEHSLVKLIKYVSNTRGGWVSRIDLFSLSPEAITDFISDSVRKEEGVRELAEAIYIKTMGNIFFTRRALEELVRKNVLFYDMMCFEWRWVASRVELENYMSDDVVETIKNKMYELSFDVKHLLVVMSFVPNAMEVPMMKALMSHGIFSFEEDTIRSMLKEASDESMLIYSTGSKCYVFAHDRIREASQEFATEVDQEELVLHISEVLQDFAGQGPEMEWCLYVAVDLLNALPSAMTDPIELTELNVRVSRIARSGGSMMKENELLHKGLQCLESSGMAWTKYNLTLELYNAVIISDHSIGAYNDARASVDHVLKNAKWKEDKLQARLYQLLCNIEETSDYERGVRDGVEILNSYGLDIPPKMITNSFMAKEEMKLRVSLRGRSYSCLAKLCVHDEPVFHLIYHVQKYASYTSNEKLEKTLGWKAIQCAIKQGFGRHFPVVLGYLASSLAKHGQVKTAQELGHVSIALLKKIPDDVEIRALTQYKAYIGILPQLQSFRSLTVPLLQCHKDLKLVGGDVNALLGSMLGYFQSYLAAGFELGPLLESKLLLLEELCRSLGRPGFLHTFQHIRQFALNLRKRTEDPTEFRGDAFNEEEALNEMNSNARKMALRDSTSSRLQLAFIFRDEDAMSQMLERLCDYPLLDHVIARLHNRLCFTGLSAFALSERKEHAPYLRLGQNCLSYFANLTKHGSVNAKAVYQFMLAMKGPSREAFIKAIDTCSEASMLHLEAMAKERYAMLLEKESDKSLADEYITSSYWLYQDWGAHAKALQLSKDYEFLKYATREDAKSMTLSTAASGKSMKPTHNFNTAFKRSHLILVKQ